MQIGRTVRDHQVAGLLRFAHIHVPDDFAHSTFSDVNVGQIL